MASATAWDCGLAATETAGRDRAATQVAGEVAAAYRCAGGWNGVDLAAAAAVASGAGAHLVVFDRDGSAVSGAGRGRGVGGPGASIRSMVDRADAPVVVDGAAVGSVRLTFAAGAGSAAQHIAWQWIAVAAVAALALAVSWYVTRRITGPLVRLAGAARAFAAGGRSVGPGSGRRESLARSATRSTRWPARWRAPIEPGGSSRPTWRTSCALRWPRCEPVSRSCATVSNPLTRAT